MHVTGVPSLAGRLTTLPDGHGLGPGEGSTQGVGSGASGLSNMGPQAVAARASNEAASTRITNLLILPPYHPRMGVNPDGRASA